MSFFKTHASCANDAHVVPYSNHTQNGFSLLELSIVLVIIGLLTGGVLLGRNLVHAAEMRSILTQFKSFQTAVIIFEEKYGGLPGDLTNATELWGRADTGAFSGQCASPSTNVGTGNQTCNGNGDRKIGNWFDVVEVHAPDYYETFRFWQQLANGNLISGHYTGVRGPNAPTHAILDVNVPISRVTSVGWSVEYIEPVGFVGFGGTLASFSGQYMAVGLLVEDNVAEGPFLTPEDALSIDAKIDDGMPAKGNVKAIWWDECTLASSVTDLDAGYDLSNSDIACALGFMKPF
jgi:prepilin-type N-terminal cleavage/methylation domain-containing protein